VPKKRSSGRAPVPDDLPPDLPDEERRPARMRLVAGRRLAGVRVVLDGVHDPHNISAVLRSCEGFGLQHVHLIGRTGGMGVNRAITLGCHKWLDLHAHADAGACASALHEQGFELWAAVPDRAAQPIEALDFGRKVALVFGGERDGLSDELLAACDGRYQIPMPGFSQSLNVSVAAAISIYIATSLRRRAVGGPTDLSPAEVEALAQAWIAEDEARRARGRLSGGTIDDRR
jgi:tRNA (guanosine-2'-O-)-methyltransferase